MPKRDCREELGHALARVEEMDLADLRVFWRARFGTKPLYLQSTELTRYEIAWRLQGAVEGDLDRITRRKLKELAAAAAAPDDKAAARPKVVWSIGTRLVREWRGETHYVEVAADGFLYAGEAYGSLTAIARKISGVHRSGVKFFQARAQ